MKISNLFAVATLGAIMAAPVMAEPPSFQSLSFRAKPTQMSDGDVKIVRNSGMDKYLPYHSRSRIVSPETEIAAFEDAGETTKSYVKPVRSDRVPAM